MDMQGLIAVLEADELDLVGRGETRFFPVFPVLRSDWWRGWLR